MSKKTDAPVAFHHTLMGLGLMLFLVTVVTTPDAELHFFGLYWPVTWLMEMTSIGLFVFGFVFGLLAAISARRGHVLRMKQEAAEAQAAAAPDSPSESDVTQQFSTGSSAAVFTSPEPRVMVVDTVAKPNMEFPTSPKA